jgi:hypothetical protein
VARHHRGRQEKAGRETRITLAALHATTCRIGAAMVHGTLTVISAMPARAFQVAQLWLTAQDHDGDRRWDRELNQRP